MPRRRYREGIKTLDNALETYIRQALETPAETLEAMEKTDQGFTFLHSLAKVTRDRKVIRDQLMSLLLAARVSHSWTISSSQSHQPSIRSTFPYFYPILPG